MTPQVGPLLRWDGAHLVLDLPALTRTLQERLAALPDVELERIDGVAEMVRLSGMVRWRGIGVRVVLELGEFRLRHRHLGLRIRRVRTVGRIRLPRAMLERLLEKVGAGTLKVVRGEGIVLVDLRGVIAPQVDLSLVSVQATGHALHMWLGPGSVRASSAADRPALPAVAGAHERTDVAG